MFNADFFPIHLCVIDPRPGDGAMIEHKEISFAVPPHPSVLSGDGGIIQNECSFGWIGPQRDYIIQNRDRLA